MTVSRLTDATDTGTHTNVSRHHSKQKGKISRKGNIRQKTSAFKRNVNLEGGDT